MWLAVEDGDILQAVDGMPLLGHNNDARAQGATQHLGVPRILFLISVPVKPASAISLPYWSKVLRAPWARTWIPRSPTQGTSTP